MFKVHTLFYCDKFFPLWALKVLLQWWIFMLNFQRRAAVVPVCARLERRGSFSGFESSVRGFVRNGKDSVAVG